MAATKAKKTTKAKTAKTEKEPAPKKKASGKVSVPDKNAKILILVESPNKCATITKITKDLGYKHVTVKASVGHFTEIKDGGGYKNTGIAVRDKFKPNICVSENKKKVVAELKEAVEKADYIYICSDEDREGESIGSRMKTFLKIPESKYGRATFHEITKGAIEKALQEPRKIDQDLVEAAEARQVLDKIMGYALSPLARRNLGCKSVGRCQSAGLLLITERENEIRNFVPEKYYDLYLLFKKHETEFKAKYVGTAEKAIKRIDTLEECEKIKKECATKPFSIKDIEKKELKDNPKPPFTTSTFEQEANKLYGISIDQALSCAQKLFEGINIKGEHIALVTYIRTDDTSMSPEFTETLERYVKGHYGDKYYAPVRKAAKGETAQEGHECLRVIDLDMTPEKLSGYISDSLLLKIYKLIWERTVMSSMAAAVINDTIYTIKNGKHLFVMHSRELKFDGYRKIRSDADTAVGKEELIKETFAINEDLQDTSLKEEYKETTPPKRYTQATLVKELEDRGIGRPSTFATIVKTVLAEDRGYCEVGTGKEKTISPTEKGMRLSEFLHNSFSNVINFDYTKELEANLDKIANGKEDRVEFLQEFFDQLEDSMGKVKPVERIVPEETSEICPNCGKPLLIRTSRATGKKFLGCSGYPNCKFIKNLDK